MFVFGSMFDILLSVMKTNIYFVRHAECESNVNPLFDGDVDGLTEKGKAQAKLVAKYFAEKNISNIFASSVFRAKQTAQEIAGVCNKETIVLDLLKERSLVHTTSDECVYTEDYSLFSERLLKAREFLQNLPEGDHVVVSHAIFLKTLISSLLLGNMFSEEIAKQIASSLIIDNVSITKCMFTKEKNKWKLDYINKKIAP